MKQTEMLKTLFVFFLFISAFSCHNKQASEVPEQVTDNMATGDPDALSMALKIESAAGGKNNWNKVHYLGFQFLTSRIWFWDKFTNKYRVESLKKKYRIAGTLNGDETILWLNGKLETNPDSLAVYKKMAYELWIHDSYWLILPFKLFDPGVHMKYMGIQELDTLGRKAGMELTFDSVGVTPDNKFQIFVDTTSNQIAFWKYFRHKADTIAVLSNVWTEYQQYGQITLSSGRGKESMKDIRVYEELPEKIFMDLTVPATEILKEMPAK